VFAVYVCHPIQDQTPEEIAARADALNEIVSRLTRPTREPDHES
jgi:hypothetical protein